MSERRRLTPKEMHAIVLEVRADCRDAVAEARQIGKQLDEQSRLRAQVAAERARLAARNATRK